MTSTMPSAPREPSLDTGITEEPKSEAQCKKRRPRAPVTLAQVKRKLVTKEDRFHLHKTFGTLALISFGYRYFYVWPTTGHLGLDVDALGIGTMAVHTLLSLTSLPFRVPLRRIRKQPTMIWQEYRLHAVIFTLRCAIVFAFATASVQGAALRWAQAAALLLSSGCAENAALVAPYILQAMRLLAVISMHVCADVTSHVLGADGETTVRGDAKRPPRMKAVRKLMLVYAAYQFLALGSHLVAIEGLRYYDLAYNTLIAIQSSAFCMTLNRKGLIRWQAHALIYSVSLLLSAGYIVRAVAATAEGAADAPMFIVAVLLAFVARTRFRASKYLIWPAFSICWVAWQESAARVEVLQHGFGSWALQQQAVVQPWAVWAATNWELWAAWCAARAYMYAHQAPSQKKDA